ncbi:16S rRNA (cytosine(967)-C(5))-methyltransferase [Psittacicella melopsittaci]|uniref:16S rRNA (cytosine(967)-C(5))-methyltransferase n=1 Tax=Psittacicella melopsittaci TaxID=2028576 RepID=A0A3A1Y7W7_9GAMM|nr:16S rRNA (cytosine(967)-C(5))-methyltransferase RsmB [Psittacicella melopsittaci]RIY33319.1 16S rRNA (cytosine(967)-C(5))-methyltransferase [Psittacicella melopsittaci]
MAFSHIKPKKDFSPRPKAKAKNSRDNASNAKKLPSNANFVHVEALEKYGLSKVKKELYENPRFQAALSIKKVLEDKLSFSGVTEPALKGKDLGFASNLVYGVLRYLPQLNYISNQLLDKSFKKEHYFAQYILMVGLYQDIYMNQAQHAVVYENVEIVKQLFGKGVASLINACLRKFLREKESLLEASSKVSLLPKWLNNLLSERVAEPQFSQMLKVLNDNPPMWLRVNRDKISPEKFKQLLTFAQIEYVSHPQLEQAILLPQALDVRDIPGFEQGLFSVQDLHAQLASLILTKDNSLTQPVILDTCCSPGGKTTHLLDLVPQALMIATDIDKTRLKRVYENLQRLKLQAQVVAADARYPEFWLEKSIEQAYAQHKLEQPATKPGVDLMLLDIPCSGTGVIRRHPDIKWLRTPDDIERLAQIQFQILEKSWAYLKVGGKLLYTSCSILGQENEQVVEKFLSQVKNAQVEDITPFVNQHIDSDYRIDVNLGVQLINTAKGGDGFYYCLLTKTAD